MVIAIHAGFASPIYAQTTEHAPLTLSNPLIADISPNVIEIRSDFNGAQLLVFGARNAPGELAVVLRGPAIRATLRRKERIAGMWMHVDQRKYDVFPSFYALSSTKALGFLAPPSVLQSLGLGESRLIQASRAEPDETFDKALQHVLSKKRWWQSPFGTVTYFGESLFKARVDLPDTLPSGNYTAEVYLFNQGSLVGLQMIPFSVHKTGFDAYVAARAKSDGVRYGLFAVAMALFGGWLGHRLFGRRRA